MKGVVYGNIDVNRKTSFLTPRFSCGYVKHSQDFYDNFRRDQATILLQMQMNKNMTVAKIQKQEHQRKFNFLTRLHDVLIRLY